MFPGGTIPNFPPVTPRVPSPGMTKASSSTIFLPCNLSKALSRSVKARLKFLLTGDIRFTSFTLRLSAPDNLSNSPDAAMLPTVPPINPPISAPGAAPTPPNNAPIAPPAAAPALAPPRNPPSPASAPPPA